MTETNNFIPPIEFIAADLEDSQAENFSVEEFKRRAGLSNSDPQERLRRLQADCDAPAGRDPLLEALSVDEWPCETAPSIGEDTSRILREAGRGPLPVRRKRLSDPEHRELLKRLAAQSDAEGAEFYRGLLKISAGGER